MFRGGSPASGIAAFTGGNVAFVLSRCSTPGLRSPTGTMGNNGAYVSGTAFTKTYPKCYMYFGAAQIAATGPGSAAGWYYAEGSSTTAFTIYNNTYTSGTPTPPVSKTAFVTTGPGAVTGDTTEQGYLPTIAANQLGNSGWFRVSARFTNNNTGGNKSHRLRYTGVGGTQLVGQVNTTAVAGGFNCVTMNSMATNAQESFADQTSSAGALTVQAVTSAIDTTAITNPAVTTQIAIATDWAVIEWYIVELMQDGT